MEQKPIIIEEHLGLVRSIVLQFDKNLSDSDLYGIGCVALVEAYNSYEPEKGAFSTWATMIIKQSIFDFFRKNKKHKTVQHLDGDVQDNFRAKLPADLLQILLQEDTSDSKVDKENKKILIDHFLNDKSWAEIGRNLKITRERVRQKGSEALSKIRKRYRFLLDEAEFLYF